MKYLFIFILCAWNYVLDINCNIVIPRSMTNRGGTIGGYYDTPNNRVWINQQSYRGNYPQTGKPLPLGIPVTISTSTTVSSTTILPVTTTESNINTTANLTFNPTDSTTLIPIKVTTTNELNATKETINTIIQPTRNPILNVCEGLHGNFIPDPIFCGSFYRCVWGKAYSFKCAPGTLYDSNTNLCLFSQKVDCGTRKL